MRKVKIGIIGCGRIAKAHANAIKDLSSEVEAVAVADKVEAKAREMASVVGASYWTSDYKKLLEMPDVEAVIIALPHHLHYRVTLDALEAQKDVLLEKPMALKYIEAQEMVEKAEKLNRILMIGQSRRFCEACKILKREIDTIGPLIRIVINFLVYFPEPPTDWWKSPEEAGDLITYLQASHSIDLILWLIGKPPEKIFAQGASRNPKKINIQDEEDIFLRFPGDIFGSVHLSLNTKPPVHEYIIVGEKGSFHLQEYQIPGEFRFGYRLLRNGEILIDGEQIPTNYTLQLREFLDAVKYRREPLASGREILPSVKVLELVSLSSRLGKAIEFTEY
ncbi:MAG: Gfo/Idh/MocA family oxidoreductase [Synergistetes bacterium]|nr:Gfo/Idh/MocA family oxidoreductase [Synergistota bacterium]MDW8193177.1 Gfo/Idh/MocA family oxidoreductase [Synergistota bacterium]